MIDGPHNNEARPCSKLVEHFKFCYCHRNQDSEAIWPVKELLRNKTGQCLIEARFQFLQPLQELFRTSRSDKK